MRIFAPDWVTKWMQIFGMKEDDALEDRLVTKQIERAQRKVEAHNFDIRKNLLDYDDVANDQRKVIYEQRNDLLEAEDVGEGVQGIRQDVIETLAKQFVAPNSIDEQWDLDGLARSLEQDFGIVADPKRWVDAGEETSAEHVWKRVQEDVDRHFREKEAQFGSEQMRAIEKFFMLQVLDQGFGNCAFAVHGDLAGRRLRRLGLRHERQWGLDRGPVAELDLHALHVLPAVGALDRRAVKANAPLPADRAADGTFAEEVQQPHDAVGPQRVALDLGRAAPAE